MKAVILAAGKGTRMKDLTNEVPKPMLLARGKPILEHIIEGLASNEIRDIFIVTGYRGEVIKEHFGQGSKWNARIVYGQQAVQNGTGKAPEAAKSYVASSPFLLTYGDILVPPINYRRMLSRFSERSFSGLVTVTRGEDITKGGLNFFDKNFCLRQVVEKPGAEKLQLLKTEGLLQPGQPLWYNAGIYIFTPTLFEFTAQLEKSPRSEYELTDAINALVQAGHTLAGLEIEGKWVDVRDPEVLARVEHSGI